MTGAATRPGGSGSRARSDGPLTPGAEGREPRPLRLRAADVEDLAIVSAALQDAIVAVGDIGWLPDDRRFAMVVNRFMWDAAPAEGATATGGDADTDEGDVPVYHRTHCGVRFERVRRVVARGVDLAERGRLLELLAIESVVDADGARMLLVFAGGAEIRLDAEAIDCRLEDLGTPWPTTRRPRHEIEDGAESD
ncbi:MAG: DUF2948 family protein [Azospirillaceae bacterium]